MTTNEEKAKELSYCHCNEKSCRSLECKNCPKAEIDDAVIQMAEWKDKQYKVLIDYIVEFLNDSWYDCETFSECMPEWCEKNCGSHNPNFNAECIINWIKKQNEKPKLKVVRGVEGRGEDVIKLLESMGGINEYKLEGDNSNAYYYIDNVNGKIYVTMSSSSFFNNYELEFINLPKAEK